MRRICVKLHISSTGQAYFAIEQLKARTVGLRGDDLALVLTIVVSKSGFDPVLT